MPWDSLRMTKRLDYITSNIILKVLGILSQVEIVSLNIERKSDKIDVTDHTSKG